MCYKCEIDRMMDATEALKKRLEVLEKFREDIFAIVATSPEMVANTEQKVKENVAILVLRDLRKEK